MSRMLLPADASSQPAGLQRARLKGYAVSPRERPSPEVRHDEEVG